MSPRQELGEAGRIPADLRDALADLRAARRAALAEAAELAAERNALAAEARRGDAAAQERLGKLNRDGAGLATRIDHFDADEDALRERFGEVLELQQRATPGRPDPVSIAKALAAQDRRADALMQSLETVLFARAGLARRLANTGKGSLRALASVARLRAAAEHHGLGPFFELPPMPAHLQAPLATINGRLLDAVLHPRPRRIVSAVPPASVEIPEEIPA